MKRLKFTFPRKLRLNTSEQFKQIFNKAKKTTTKMFGVFCCVNNFDKARLGVIVSKKNINDASKRNQFKRQVRESFRLRQHDLKGFDIVVLACKGAKKIAQEELRKNLEQQWDRICFQQKKP